MSLKEYEFFLSKTSKAVTSIFVVAEDLETAKERLWRIVANDLSSTSMHEPFDVEDRWDHVDSGEPTIDEYVAYDDIPVTCDTCHSDLDIADVSYDFELHSFTCEECLKAPKENDPLIDFLYANLSYIDKEDAKRIVKLVEQFNKKPVALEVK